MAETESPAHTQPPARDIYIASVVLPSLLQPYDWVFRRVESIRFFGDSRVRRQVSVDFRWPKDARPTVGRSIPLALLSKAKPLISLDVVDESGRVLPVLTQSQNAGVAGGVLVLTARQALGSDPDAELIALLYAIAGASPMEAAELEQELRGYQGALGAQAQVILQDAYFRTLLSDLMENFLLLAYVPGSELVRRVVKFSYDEDVPWPRLSVLGRERLFTRLGWRPASLLFRAPALGAARSYHFQLQAPAGLECSGVRLIPSPGAAGSPHRTRLTEATAHLHVSAASRHEKSDVEVLLRVPSRGLVAAACSGSVLTAIVLVLAVVRFDRVKALESQADAAAAVLLGVLSVGLASLVRPGEHALVWRLLIGMRVAVGISAVAAFFVALVIVAGIAGIALFVCLLVAAISSAVAAAALVRTAIAGLARPPPQG